VRLVGRLFASLFAIVVLAAAVYGGALGLQWLDDKGVFDAALDRQPEQPLALSSLNRYTHEAAGKASFRRYFTSMVFSREHRRSAGPGPIVAKWERRRVVIKLQNDGGPGVESYLRQLVRRLNRMQAAVRFVVGDASPRITIRFLPHDDYVQIAGPDTVGTTSTRYYSASPGLINARILIDADTRDTPGEVRSTLIHELTHAIGCSGHLTSPSDRRRSVLYTSSQITSWSQTDAAVIRLLYSPWIRSGMTPARATASLQLYAQSGN
jgi:hypothetical protein